MSEKSSKWLLSLITCGVLVVYTIPTNSIFVLGLGVWMIFVATVPSLAGEFNFKPTFPSRRFFHFLWPFLLIAILSFLTYVPILESLLEIFKKKYLNLNIIYESQYDLAINLIPDLLIRIFPGPLIWFSPFIILGILFGSTRNLSYRFLPLFILFIRIVSS